MRNFIYANPPGPHRGHRIELVLPEWASGENSPFYHEATMGRLRGAYRMLRRKKWQQDGDRWRLVPGVPPELARRAVYDTLFACYMSGELKFSTPADREFARLVEASEQEQCDTCDEWSDELNVDGMCPFCVEQLERRG